MDLIKKYGAKELALMMHKEIQERRIKRERDLQCCLADLNKAKSRRLAKKKIRR